LISFLSTVELTWQVKNLQNKSGYLGG